MPRQKLPARVNGPYYLATRKKWRIRIFDAGRIEDVFFDSEKEARQAIVSAAKKLTTTSRILSDLLGDYFAEKERHGLAKPETCEHQRACLERFFGEYVHDDLGKITPRRAEALYHAAVTKPCEKYRKPVSTATHRFYRDLAHGFFLWATRKGYVTESPFRNVRPVGRVSTGKAQLTLDEAKRYRDTALRLFDEKGDVLALAAVVPLYLGLRRSEVLSRRVRDLDCNGTMLRIDRGKTKNARRYIAIKASALRERLLKLATGRQPHELLLHTERTETPHAGQSLNGAVTRVCASAGVPVVCPHSLRGLWATLGVESGAAESAVATALGHGSFEITARHYAQPEALTDARSDRVAEFLDGDCATVNLAALPAENLLAKLPQCTLDQLALLLVGKPRSPTAA